MEAETSTVKAWTQIKRGVRAAGRQLTRYRREILAGAGAFLIVSALGATFELYSDYLHYAAQVDTQITHQYLQRTPGIYAAPRHLSVGQRLSPEELKDRLLRADYQEGGEASRFASGSFVAQADAVEAQTNEAARNDALPERTRIRFSTKAKGDGEIIAIEDLTKGGKLQSVLLPAELITADLNAKTQTRSFADFSQFPSVLVKALTSVEDRNFFAHPGLDLKGICRAMIRNEWNQRIREGGSTITQQLIKTLFLSSERTWRRKYAEAMMALAIERRLSKEQIFTLYANRIYLGSSGVTMVYGFKQAAEVYFGKEMSELSLGEAALLAGLAQAPSRYSPYSHPEAAVARRNVALRAMAEAGSISEAEAAAAQAEPLTLAPPPKPDKSIAPHFLDYVSRELAKGQVNDEEMSHLQIETTIDPDLQQAANQTVQEHLARLDKLFAKRNPDARPEAGLIALDPHTGEILAMVGGRDYTASQLNRVTDARRQPGSLFKPIVYAAALRRGLSPTTTFDDSPQKFDFGYKAVYTPQNYGHAYSNQPVMLRDGIVRSLNVVAVQAALQVGLSNVADMAERVGLPRPQAYPSMALGAFEATPFEIAGAYTTFANEGLRVTPVGIKAIKNADEVVYEAAAAKAGALSPTESYLITDTLADVVNHGTASRIRQAGYRGPAAGKTGSSRDAWFAGYTPTLLVVIWVGFDDYRDLGLTGGEAAAPIWADFVKRALALRPDLQAAKFKAPSGLEAVEIDPENGMLANEFCPARRRILLPSYLTPPSCEKHHAAAEGDEELTFEMRPISDQEDR
jgi:penicillin-binding protein 1B